MFLSINQNIGNFVNNALLYFKNKSSTEQSLKEIEATTEEQDVDNSDIQRDLKEEFLREVQYFSRDETSYGEFIEKFLDNPKFSNVLTKKVDHQDLSEIETILLNSIKEHLELLRRFESLDNHFYTFLADPLNEQYYPEREDFETEQEYLQCVQECEQKHAETSEKFEAQYQKYKALIADSLAQIEQQLSEPYQEAKNMKLAS